jgi:hypothetical protein
MYYNTTGHIRVVADDDNNDDVMLYNTTMVTIKCGVSDISTKAN